MFSKGKNPTWNIIFGDVRAVTRAGQPGRSPSGKIKKKKMFMK